MPSCSLSQASSPHIQTPKKLGLWRLQPNQPRHSSPASRSLQVSETTFVGLVGTTTHSLKRIEQSSANQNRASATPKPKPKPKPHSLTTHFLKRIGIRHTIRREFESGTMKTMAGISTLIAVLLTALLLPAADAALRVDKASSSWTTCSSKDYAVTIEDVNITPDPVVSGQVATFSIPAYTSETLEGGTCVVSVSIWGIKVYTERNDLCSKASCPLDGKFTLVNSEAMPSYSPPGSYKLQFQILSSSGSELACASVSFNIVWGTESAEEVVEYAKEEASRKLGVSFL